MECIVNHFACAKALRKQRQCKQGEIKLEDDNESKMDAIGLKYKNLLDELNLLQEELDLLQGSIQEEGN